MEAEAEGVREAEAADGATDDGARTTQHSRNGVALSSAYESPRPEKRSPRKAATPQSSARKKRALMSPSTPGNGDDASEEDAEEDAYMRMSLEERRLYNLKRQQAMLLQQFADIPDLLPQSKKQKAHSDRHTADDGPSAPGSRVHESSLAPTLDVEQMIAQWPHRGPQIRHLFGILSAERSPPAPLLLSGPSGTGKSAIVTGLCKGLPRLVVSHILCRGFLTSKQLFRHIVQRTYAQIVSCSLQLSFDKTNVVERTDLFEAGDWTRGKRVRRHMTVSQQSRSRHGAARGLIQSHITSIDDLYTEICVMARAVGRSSRRLVLVLDQLEETERLERGLAHQLLFMKQHAHADLTVVAITRRCDGWTDCVRGDPCVRIPFNQYTDEQLTDVLIAMKRSSLSPEASFSEAQYRSFLSYFLVHVGYVARHPAELFIAAERIYARFLQEQHRAPSTSTSASPSLTSSSSSSGGNVDPLYLAVKPHLDRCAAQQVVSLDRDSCPITAQATDQQARSSNWCLDLPYYTKYLMIAAFLASHNDPASDIFTFTAKNKGRRRQLKKGEDDTVVQPGVRVFHLERLLTIFMAIFSAQDKALQQVALHVGNADLFSEINNLVAKRFLTRVDKGDLSVPRYKSNIHVQTVEVIAKHLRFPLNDFMVAN